MPFTLKFLLEKYKVIIPQIQRDYAQGRESEYELRKGFITKIKQTLQEEEPVLNLDFIYGYTEKAGKDEDVFIPLDGQQRLTTLWLVHWYLAPRIENELDENVKSYLSRFTYETRMSSKRFCHNLIQQPLKIKPNIPISEQITDVSWFMASWSNDPTVLSILNMLDTLQQEMPELSGWENLIAKEKITFDFIDIKSDEFKLTDELYIKMNSRGKPLTPFENFKAQFSGLLVSKKTDYVDAQLFYEGTSISYQQYFAFKIDSEWMDLFWNYRNKTVNKIDNNIYRFIYYVAEFLFFRGNPNANSFDVKNDFDFLNGVFSKKNNIDFLFNALDFIASLEDVNLFFENIFNEVSVFDNYTKDYFYRAINNTSFDVKDKTLLYAILAYCTETGYKEVDGELQDFVRIVRNLLLTVRQPNQSKRIEYTTNLRLPDVSKYCRFIDAFVNKIKEQKKPVYAILSENDFIGFTDIENEKTKASLIVQSPKLKSNFHKLEEHPQLQGNLSCFKLDSDDIEQKIYNFLRIWNDEIPESYKIRAFLTIDDYAVITHEKSSLGEIWFFGCKDGWNKILTAADKNERAKILEALDKFLVEFDKAEGSETVEKLQYIIDHFIPTEKDWRYYFIKYKSISENPFIKLNVYAWNDSRGFDIHHLGNSGVQPLHSYHLNPYLITLRHIFTQNKMLTLYWGRFTDPSYIKIEEKFRIYCKSDGWLIKPLENYIIADKLFDTYSLSEKNDGYILKEPGNKDRIEVAVDFINDVLE